MANQSLLLLHIVAKAKKKIFLLVTKTMNIVYKFYEVFNCKSIPCNENIRLEELVRNKNVEMLHPILFIELQHVAGDKKLGLPFMHKFVLMQCNSMQSNTVHKSFNMR